MGGDGRARRPEAARAARQRARAERAGQRIGAGRQPAADDAEGPDRGGERPRNLGEGGMILAIDAGNSRVKWGWHDGTGWTSIATVSLIEFAASSDHVNPFSVTHEDPERIIIS